MSEYIAVFTDIPMDFLREKFEEEGCDTIGVKGVYLRERIWREYGDDPFQALFPDLYEYETGYGSWPYQELFDIGREYLKVGKTFLILSMVYDEFHPVSEMKWVKMDISNVPIGNYPEEPDIESEGWGPDDVDRSGWTRVQRNPGGFNFEQYVVYKIVDGSN